MSHSPGIGAHVQGAANGVATLESPKLCGEEVSLVNDLPTLQPLKHGEIVPCRAPKLAVGSPVEEVNCEGQPEEERDTDTSHTCTSDMPCLDTPQSDAYSEEPHIKEPHIEEHHSELICTDVPQTTADGVLGSSLPDGARRVEEEEEEVVEEEEDEEVQQQQQREVEEQNEGQDDTEDSPELSADSPTVSEPPTESQVHPKDPLPSEEQEACRSPPRCQEPPCPPHVMAQVHVRNAPERERIVRGMQDSKSLDEISQVCGGMRGRGGQAEGRRATISSALELEGTVSRDGELTHFITKNLEHKIRMSSRPSLDSDSDYSVRSRGSLRRPVDIPPIDPSVLLDLQRHTQDVAQSVELMMRSLNGTIQNMTALSVGYIQTYRDSVDSLGEAVDMSIKGMYTLMARCEELDRSMQPIHALAQQIRDIKRTLDALETLCK
ncbi:BLOC-1-related complex subunit 6 isoform X1 [Anguilla anguilla]|uniref:BLOC-1-related complex subunit 6 isoform X1 n=1 Tax=Anguilla anguilla TaxID=7936 RepID=UPI0015B07231|nr:BLOC-1-related complex subunit 6 isoform X1 [Anguilla anguilla]XP_035239415.1 BLOC-1-related complex subunit 6 isoform X1 [Anguilla anguilla]XP_035239416.1 BLOC-1-related complex subunit 6 isoform X1 [Anguilla anguilla]